MAKFQWWFIGNQPTHQQFNFNCHHQTRCKGIAISLFFDTAYSITCNKGVLTKTNLGIKPFFLPFYLGFLSMTLMIHGTAGTGEGASLFLSTPFTRPGTLWHLFAIINSRCLPCIFYRSAYN